MPLIPRRDFIGGALSTTALSGVPHALPADRKRPNILFILADDLGYGDLSCYGRPDYKTPVLDDLAQQGMKFTSAYAAAPLCTPTRCAFITGRYPQRLAVGLEEPLKPTSNVGLPPDEPTVASRLKSARYDTALIGKWHLGRAPEFGPNRHGFDEFFGVLNGAIDYFTHTGGGGADLWENLRPIERVGYLTDLFSERAVEYVTRPRAQPFFLSLQYTAPHAPWEGPEDEAIGHTAHGPGPMTAGGSLKIFGTMVRSMDRGIGRVLAALDSAKLARDTLVIFTSDNGGERYSFNWPFSYQKGDLHEGGTRVPAMVRWPGVISERGITDQPAITMDWTATILAAAGAGQVQDSPLDGVDLLPTCTGARAPFEREMFWRVTGFDAARVGKWKYLKAGGAERLFDLSIDPGEKTDLRLDHPGVFARIRAKYEAWNARMLPRPV